MDIKSRSVLARALYRPEQALNYVKDAIKKEQEISNFENGDSQIISALMHPVDAINRGGEWFRHNVSQASGGDPYDNPNPLFGPGLEEQAQAGLNLAGLAQLGGMPGAPSSAGGTLGTFIGPKAKTWDAKRAALAEKLLNEGADPAQVWKEHLIGRLPGKQLFSEIPDHIASITPNQGAIENGATVYRGKLTDLLHHKPLYDNYDMSDINATLRTGIPEEGAYNPNSPLKGPWLEAGAQNLDELKPVVIHEAGHIVQSLDDLPRGGSPINNSPLAMETYNRLTGEALSRAAAKRSDMSMAQRREAYPLANDMLDDVPLKGSKGLIDYYGPGPQKMVPPSIANSLNVKTNLPSDELFQEAVKNTPGARLNNDGLLMALQRNQLPEQAYENSVRGGVFYLPEGAAQGKHYSTGKNGYGGRDKITGESLIKNPLFVKGATGGKAPEMAFDAIHGKGKYQEMRNEALKSLKGPEQVYNFLRKYAPELEDNADYIFMNSRQGNQLPYALQEAAVSSAVRNHGYDSVLGHSKGKAGPFISEVFDVRERTYPNSKGETDIFDSFKTKNTTELPETEYSLAHKVAQEHAALPVEQGGLGLPPNNTAMDRARALGFDTDAYHGTQSNITEFNRNKGNIMDSGARGEGEYFTNDPDYAGKFTWMRGTTASDGNIIPVKLRTGNSFKYSENDIVDPRLLDITNKEHLKHIEELNNESKNSMFSFLNDSPSEIEPYNLHQNGINYDDYVMGQGGIKGKKFTEILKSLGHDSVNYSNGRETVIFNPKNIRSRFAAFDPFKKDSANILASILAGTTLVSQMDKNNGNK